MEDKIICKLCNRPATYKTKRLCKIHYLREYIKINKQKLKAKKRKYYLNNKGIISKKQREYEQRPEIKEKIRRNRRKWEKENRQHLTEYQRGLRKRKFLEYKARDYVMKKVKQDKLKKASSLRCNQCNKKAVSYHHYLGYSKEHWLDIKPLCGKCHIEQDRKLEVKI